MYPVRLDLIFLVFAAALLMEIPGFAIRLSRFLAHTSQAPRPEGLISLNAAFGLWRPQPPQ
jgi:hypothetical protein